MKLLILITLLSVQIEGFPQTPAQLSSVVGTVIEKTGKTINIKTDQNTTIAIRANETTACLRVPAGAQSLDKATPILFEEIVNGDRVLARGNKAPDEFAAVRIVVLSKDDVTKKRERDLEEWRTRGIAGVVKALNPGTNEINLELRGATPASLVAINASASQFRRYTTTAINFEDTKQSNFAEVAVGDQLRALGDKSADGKSFKAEAVVSGSFKTIGATVTAIDLQNNQISAATLDQRKPIKVTTLKQTLVRRIPAALVPAIAQKARANQSAEVQQLIDTLPVVALSDLKAGDVVSITGIREKDESQMTAIKLVAGIDAVLRAMAPQPGRPQTVRLSAGLPNAFDFSVIP
ncbi:MAG TPA: hypothetical protein VFI24_16855 [Pyrinomonadaceae bacterium]|nr:hypothetical protein [Pyrinomonadaceae bacterium]